MILLSGRLYAVHWWTFPSSGNIQSLNSAHCTSRNDGAPISQGCKKLFDINIALCIKKGSTFLTALQLSCESSKNIILFFLDFNVRTLFIRHARKVLYIKKTFSISVTITWKMRLSHISRKFAMCLQESCLRALLRLTSVAQILWRFLSPTQ